MNFSLFTIFLFFVSGTEGLLSVGMIDRGLCVDGNGCVRGNSGLFVDGNGSVCVDGGIIGGVTGVVFCSGEQVGSDSY